VVSEVVHVVVLINFFCADLVWTRNARGRVLPACGLYISHRMFLVFFFESRSHPIAIRKTEIQVVLKIQRGEELDEG